MVIFSNLDEIVNDTFKEILANCNISDTIIAIEENKLGKTGIHIIAKLTELKQNYHLFNLLATNKLESLANDIFCDIIFREFLLDFSVRLLFKLLLIEDKAIDILVEKILLSYISIHNNNILKEYNSCNNIIDERFFASFAINHEETKIILQKNFWLVSLYLIWLY